MSRRFLSQHKDNTLNHNLCVLAPFKHLQVYEARKRGIPVVSPAWLECSRVLWKRADEEAFPVH